MSRPKDRSASRSLSGATEAPALDALQPAGLNEVELAVFGRLVEAIMERRLTPGLKLNEEELAGIFSVTRERIRRILLVLSQHGIVRLEPNRGASVASPSGAERREVAEARHLLERHVVERLANLEPARRRTIVSALRSHLEREQEALRAEDRPLQIRLSGDFHLTLAAHAGNRQILRMLQEMVARMSLSLSAHAHAHALDCSLGEHAALLDAIEAGRADEAVQLMEAHLGHIRDDLEGSLGAESALQRALAGGR